MYTLTMTKIIPVEKDNRLSNKFEYVTDDYSFIFKRNSDKLPLDITIENSYKLYLELKERLQLAGLINDDKVGVNGSLVFGQLAEKEQAVYLHVPDYASALFGAQVLHAPNYDRAVLEQKAKNTNQFGGLFFLSFSLLHGTVVGLPMREIVRLSDKVQNVQGQTHSYEKPNGEVVEFANNLGYSPELAVGMLSEMFKGYGTLLENYDIEPSMKNIMNLEIARMIISKDHGYLLNNFNLIGLMLTGQRTEHLDRILELVSIMDDVSTLAVALSEHFNYSGKKVKSLTNSYAFYGYGRMGSRNLTRKKTKNAPLKDTVEINYTPAEIKSMEGLPISFLAGLLSPVTSDS